MRRSPKWMRTMGLVTAAFAGGAFTSHLASATTQAQSPYAPFEQLARVLVHIENEYVEPAQRSKIIDGAMKGMVAELDPHSAYMTPDEYAEYQEEIEGKYVGVGVEVELKDDYVTVIATKEGSPAERAGLRPGDQIAAVDGRPTRGERIDKLTKLIRGPAGTKVKVSVRRTGAADLLTFELTREEIHVISVVAKRLDRDVAYVQLRQFQEGTHEELLRAAASLRAASKAPLAGVLLDMRNNPGGLVREAVAVADELMPSGTIYSARHRNRVIELVNAHAGGAFAALPVVVLVNEYSASSAELVAGALQDSRRATLVGATTYGKGSVQSIIDLPSGAGMRLTTMLYYTPSGRSIQAQGIRPDIVIAGAQPATPGDVVREQDLEGHLPAQGAAGARKPRAVIVEQTPQAASPPAADRSGDVPSNPTKGTDFALSVAYQQLLQSMPNGR